jgi:ribosomal protein S18 acetylase RimI-like enzyme
MTEFGVVVENLRHTLRAFGRATGAGEIREYPGVTLANSGIAVPLFNAALVVPPGPVDAVELERRTDSAATYYGGRELPWSLWVPDDLLEEQLRQRVETLLTRRRLRPVARCPGMLAECLAPPRRQLPVIKFRPVLDAAERMAFCHIMTGTFEISFERARRFYEPEVLWASGFAGYVGYVDGNAVAAAATMVAAGAVGIYAVATLPAWRRRGIGEAMTRHALAQARCASGIERSVLQSTHSGLLLYRQMGYRQVTTFNVYKTDLPTQA